MFYKLILSSIFIYLFIYYKYTVHNYSLSNTFFHRCKQCTYSLIIVTLAVFRYSMRCSIQVTAVISVFSNSSLCRCTVLSLVSSILTLTLIACDRFFGIVFAMKARVTERRSTLLIAFVWIFAVLLSSPILVYRRQFVRHWLNHVEIWCDDTWPPVRRDRAANACLLTSSSSSSLSSESERTLRRYLYLSNHVRPQN